MAHDVFISYPSENKVLADAICAKLESNSIRCWIAPRDILPGQNYAEALLRAIDSSKIFILVFSKNTNSSPHILSEVQRAFNHNQIIIPFRIEDIDPSIALEYYISNAHWLDAITLPIEAQIDKLLQVVKINLDPRIAFPKDDPLREGPISQTRKRPNAPKFTYPLIVLAVIVLGLGLFVLGILPSNPNPSPAPMRNQTDPVQQFSTGDILDWNRSYNLYTLILGYDTVTRTYDYITIFKEQKYYQYDRNWLNDIRHINKTGLEEMNPPVIAHLNDREVPMIPPPTPVITDRRSGKNKYGIWDWVVPAVDAKNGYVVYKFFPDSDMYEIREVHQTTDGTWASGLWSCNSRYDRSLLEKEFPVLLKREGLIQIVTHCPEYVVIPY